MTRNEKSNFSTKKYVDAMDFIAVSGVYNNRSYKKSLSHIIIGQWCLLIYDDRFHDIIRDYKGDLNAK